MFNTIVVRILDFACCWNAFGTFRANKIHSAAKLSHCIAMNQQTNAKMSTFESETQFFSARLKGLSRDFVVTITFYLQHLSFMTPVLTDLFKAQFVCI